MLHITKDQGRVRTPASYISAGSFSVSSHDVGLLNGGSDDPAEVKTPGTDAGAGTRERGQSRTTGKARPCPPECFDEKEGPSTEALGAAADGRTLPSLEDTWKSHSANPEPRGASHGCLPCCLPIFAPTPRATKDHPAPGPPVSCNHHTAVTPAATDRTDSSSSALSHSKIRKY